MAREVKITITFDLDTKDCKVTGPIGNPDLCMFGLELAREVMKQHQKRVIVPSAGIPAGIPIPGSKA